MFAQLQTLNNIIDRLQLTFEISEQEALSSSQH